MLRISTRVMSMYDVQVFLKLCLDITVGYRNRCMRVLSSYLENNNSKIKT